MTTTRSVRRSRSVGAWLVVSAVGLLVVVLVVALSLFPRLHQAQNLLTAGTPVFNAQRVAGDEAGITDLSNAVDALNPIVLKSGGASSEVGPLVAYVASKTGTSQAAVMAALEKNFPHTTALLEALPLSAVNSEIPKLETFLESTLKVTPSELVSALQTNFPALYQSISQMPYVVNGWDQVPGTSGLTRFDGSRVNTVPEIRTYFGSDVIPVLADQQSHFSALAGTFGVGYLAVLLLALGIVVFLVGLGLAILSRRGKIWQVRGTTTAAWLLVTVVGLVVVALVFGLSLFPRLSGGQSLLNQASPIFQTQRVEGDVPAITMVGHVVSFAEPVVNAQGGASSEVGPLVAFVASKTGLSQAAVLATLQKNFPHTTALLEAIPLTAVTNEIPKLETFLEGALKVTPDQLSAALQANFPDLYQSIAALPAVTNDWNYVPGTEHLTTFAGAAVHSTPQVASYFATDVVPFVVSQRANFAEASGTWPPLPVFPPLLLVVGVLVAAYGVWMIEDNRRRGA